MRLTPVATPDTLPSAPLRPTRRERDLSHPDDPRTRFSGRAGDYARWRPRYPTGLIPRLRSASYVPAPGHPRHAPMIRALDDLFTEHERDGHVVIEYDTDVFFGRLR